MSPAADGRRPSWLTDAEVDVLRLAAADLTNAEIAAQLDVTEDAVKGRMGKAIKHTRSRTRLGAVATALRAGWLEPPRPVVLPTELQDQLLVMARMVVADRPLGQLRTVCEQAVRIADGPRPNGGRRAPAEAGTRPYRKGRT